MSLGAGVAGKTKAQFQAKGVNLTVPTPVSGTQYFAMDPHVVAQLVGSNGLCLTSVFPDASKNDGELHGQDECDADDHHHEHHNHDATRYGRLRGREQLHFCDEHFLYRGSRRTFGG